MVLPNVGWLSADCTALCPRRQISSDTNNTNNVSESVQPTCVLKPVTLISHLREIYFQQVLEGINNKLYGKLVLTFNWNVNSTSHLKTELKPERETLRVACTHVFLLWFLWVRWTKFLMLKHDGEGINACPFPCPYISDGELLNSLEWTFFT
jgi:hypothetical protein